MGRKLGSTAVVEVNVLFFLVQCFIRHLFSP
jgi:hypothetical protein